jgi:hypothetical protein
MKKLTLDEAWEKCVAKWRWIRERKQAGDPRDVSELKLVWLEKNDPDADLIGNCYFCEYNDQNSTRDECHSCPLYQLSGDTCCSLGRHWLCNPIEFANWIEELYEKRKK